jgi:pilus assembly protein Flp/PilA
MRKKPIKSNLRATVAVLRRRLADDKGATAIEYALVAAGIGVAVAATVASLGSATANLFASVAALF